jgi:transposase InsO family protein
VLAELYMSRIMCLHGVPKKIVSDRGTQFTSHFWLQLHEALGTHLMFSSAYHPQTDGQTEGTNQILEDMLRAYALQDKLHYRKMLYFRRSPLFPTIPRVPSEIALFPMAHGQPSEITLFSTAQAVGRRK